MDKYKEELAISIKEFNVDIEFMRNTVRNHEEDIDYSRRSIELMKERIVCVESRLEDVIGKLKDA